MRGAYWQVLTVRSTRLWLDNIALELLAKLQGRHTMVGTEQFVEMRHVRNAAVVGDGGDRVCVADQRARGVGHALSVHKL